MNKAQSKHIKRLTRGFEKEKGYNYPRIIQIMPTTTPLIAIFKDNDGKEYSEKIVGIALVERIDEGEYPRLIDTNCEFLIMTDYIEFVDDIDGFQRIKDDKY